MGILRFILAITVVIAHSSSVFGCNFVGAQIAVQAFYIISGFYMALILNEKYVGVNGSYKLFISNRFLRLYPIYWTVLLLTIAMSIAVTIHSNGTENIHDYNIIATLNHRFSNSLKTSFRSYLTQYDSKQDLLTLSGSPYVDVLNHLFQRVENQTDWVVRKNINAIFGAGSVMEGVKSSRYDSEQLRKTNAIQYAFTQWEWVPTKKMTLIAGARLDENAAFASAFSPKFSMLYKINAVHKLKWSIGQGFKAPDFRQLYLDFTNAAAGGYSVFGSAQAQKVITQLNTLGQIGVLYDNFYQLKTLQPEFSTGIHLAWDIEPNATTYMSFQLFRNDIKNLIEVQQVGAYTSGAQIFSYLNIGRAFTTGTEFEFRKQITNQFSLNGGYQLVITGDKDQIAQIKAGTVYTRDANGNSRRLTMSDYVGLPNNSKHKAQLKLNYNNNGVFANLRFKSQQNVPQGLRLASRELRKK